MTNAGARNSFRQISRVGQSATGTWHGVASAGVTAQWLGEGAAYLFGSNELLQDSNLASPLPALLSDARANLENSAFATGAGSTEPTGVVTGVYSTTASRLSTTTGSTFGGVDVYALQQALPARARNGKSPAMVANVAVVNKLRQFDTAGGASYWTDLGKGAPASVLGLPLHEASGMVSTTTTGSKFLVAGNFDAFQIVDRIGTTLVYTPSVTDTSTGRPTGQAEWFAYWRTGSAVLDSSQFRALVA